INHDGDFQPLRQRESLLMIVFMGCFTLSTLFAIYPGRAQPEWLNMAKIILMALFTATLLTSEKRLRAFFLVVAFSLGFYGVKGGLFGFRTGGEQMVWGPTPSIIGANNGLGVAFNMCLPIFWYLAKGEQRNWLKRLLQAMFFLTIPAIMFTYSRASALAMGAVILSIILKARRKTLGVVLVVCVTLIIAGYLPEKWINRQQSTLTYEEDSSAMSRLGQWQFCWRLALDRPLTGGGFEYYSMETFARYFPEFLNTYGTSWNSHSVYFGILAAHGFPGLLMFLAMIGSCMFSLRSLKKVVAGQQSLSWIENYADMIQVSYVGFLVNGAFVNMESFDLVYHWVGIVARLKVLTHQKLSAVVTPEPPTTELLSHTSQETRPLPVYRTNMSQAARL
ncbi:MAG: putative O-glycosylation ligase, exosortase A system-associated, partial [Acidobacteria bacterium]|nr:putative O-glycosylation ligase, exosortase A system-associated [Acidobacteriota bacterium]